MKSKVLIYEVRSHVAKFWSEWFSRDEVQLEE